MWGALSGNYRLLAPDFIGFGFSDKPVDYAYSISDQADLVEDLISEVGKMKFHLLVHDYGVSVAQELIARYNEKKAAGKKWFEIHSVCFLNGGLFPGAYRPLFIQKVLSGSFGNLAAAMMNKFLFGRNLGKIFGAATQPSPQDVEDFWNIVCHHHGTRVIPKIIHYMYERTINATRWTNALKQTTIPLRLINGLDDPISGKLMVEKYKEIIPNTDVVELSGIGHYPQWEAPEVVFEAYCTFLKRCNHIESL